MLFPAYDSHENEEPSRQVCKPVLCTVNSLCTQTKRSISAPKPNGMFRAVFKT